MSTSDHLEQFLKRGMAAQRAVADLVRDPPPGRDPADLMTMQTALAVLTMAEKLRRGGFVDIEAAGKLETQARQLLRDAIGSA